MQIIWMHSLPRTVQAYVSGMMGYTLTNAGECMQVAAAWQTADPAASVGNSGSVRTASGTKALADAQKQLHISQQQASTFLHMAAGFHWCMRHDILLCSLSLATSLMQGKSTHGYHAEYGSCCDTLHQCTVCHTS